MVKHDVGVMGVDMSGNSYAKPVLLQMNDDDFPGAYLRDLSAMSPPSSSLPATPQLSSAKALPSAPNVVVTMYQPVTRVVHLAMVQLCCESPGYPRVDPKRVLSAGLVIRQISLSGGPPSAALAWMKNAQGQFSWVQRNATQADDDPDPTKRPQLQSGRADLDQLLAAQTLSTAQAEVFTPAFVAAPDICNAAQRTLVYALVPTASSEASTLQLPSVAQLDHKSIRQLLPTLLKAGRHNAPSADLCVDYHYMSDDYAKANNASDFQTFSAALRMLYTVFDAFNTDNPGAGKLVQALNARLVYMQDGAQRPMGEFYREAATKLIDYDPNGPNALPVPQLKMPHAWEFIDKAAELEILDAMAPLLQSQANAIAAPQGRFQDLNRTYCARLFFRIKGETPACPPELVWSCYSDPFRIAAWYESGGRAVAPVPLPDPFDRNVLKNAKPTSSFAVPARLMNAIGGASLTGLSGGSAPSGGGIGLGWICSFSIPLITICAFFVLSIFLSLLNIVFFWMAFIKICIPFPVPED